MPERQPALYTLPLSPVAKGRPRFSKEGRCYTPPETRAFEQDVALLCKVWFAHPLEGPLSLTVTFTQARAVTARPDLDNLLKSFVDACNGIVWQDDSQLVAITARKQQAARPSIQFAVAPLAE